MGGRLACSKGLVVWQDWQVDQLATAMYLFN